MGRPGLDKQEHDERGSADDEGADDDGCFETEGTALDQAKDEATEGRESGDLTRPVERRRPNRGALHRAEQDEHEHADGEIDREHEPPVEAGEHSPESGSDRAGDGASDSPDAEGASALSGALISL